MPRGKNACGHTCLHGLGQLEQSQRVGDLRARPPEALREHLLRDTKVFEQLLVRARFFQRVELRTVQVLEQSIPQHVVVSRVAHDRGNHR